MQRKQVAVARRAFVPVRQGARRAVAHVLRVAHVEVQVVGELEREEIAWMLTQDAFEYFTGSFELTVAPGAEGGQMFSFSFIQSIQFRNRRMNGLCFCRQARQTHEVKE